MKVTTPQEAASRREMERAGDIARLVAIVEVAVMEDRDEHWIDIRPFSAAAVRVVQATYAIAGWKVRVVDDARDGTALVLAP